MKRDPYRDQANKSRQELKTANEQIDTHDNTAGEKTRLALHSKKRDEKASQKKPFPLIRVLLALFVLLPLTVTVLSITFFNNEESVTNATLTRDNTVQLDKRETQEKTIADKDDQEKDAAEKNQQTAKESDAVELEKETAKKEEETAVEAVQPVEEPAEKPAEEAEAPPEEPEEPAEEPAEEPPAEEPAAEEASGSKTHTVQSSETLFRISVNYYGSGDFVEQIKQMNGLQTNDIHEGQVLKMP